jgi:hypothetical protein
MKINIAIITSDQSAHIVPAALYMYNKYLPNDIDYTIYVCGYKKPDIVETEKIKFIQMKERQEDINEWTTYVLSAIQTIDSEYIILAFDDIILNHSFNSKALERISSIMDSRKEIGACYLGAGPHITNADTVLINEDDFILYQRNDGCYYRVNCQPAYWRKEVLISLLKRSCSPWSLELNGGGYCPSNIKFLGCSPFNDDHRVQFLEKKHIQVFPYELKSSMSCTLIPNKVNILGIKIADLRELIELKLLNPSTLIYCIDHKINFTDIGYAFKRSMVGVEGDRHWFIYDD